MKNLTKTQKLTISALCMALYLVVMMCTQSFAIRTVPGTHCDGFIWFERYLSFPDNSIWFGKCIGKYSDGWFGTFGYVRRRFGWYYDKSDNSLC